MNDRDLFVFAGQSNMMGAAVYPVSEQIFFKDSYEYLHKPKRLGEESGAFKREGFPTGEFSYMDMALAYRKDLVTEDGKSRLDAYSINTHFCPAMCNLDSEEKKTTVDFEVFSEAYLPYAPSLAPFLVGEWERLGQKCVYAHIAKAGVPIRYYFNEKMLKRLNALISEHNEKSGDTLPKQAPASESADYFFEKTRDLILDSEQKFKGESLENKCFFWLQGEQDAEQPKALYKLYLSVLWEELKALGFTHFFCIRVGYWFNDGIAAVMQAQEEFCEENADAYMLTRLYSFMAAPSGQDMSYWYGDDTMEDYLFCRDSFYGFPNHHVNEKGLKMIASAAAENMKRVLLCGTPVCLEEEKCLPLIKNELKK